MSAELLAITATARSFFFEGREYRVPRVTPADLARMQAWLEANVPHPLDVLRPRLEGLPEAVQVKLAELAYEDARRWPPSIDDDASWTYFTMGRGRPYFVYLVLSKANPQVTEQEAARLSERMDPETFTRLGMLASGKDPDDPKTSAPSSALPADTMESPSAGG